MNISGIEYLPALTAGAGAVIGSGLEAYAQLQRHREDQRLIDQGQHLTSPSKRQRAGRLITSSLVWGGSMVGLANGIVWVEEESPITIEPGIEVVVDYSGPTLKGDQPAVESINAVIAEIAASDIDSHALVAKSGRVEDVPEIDEVSALEPFGAAPMGVATQRALDNSIRLRSEAISQGTESSVGVVVITNGNALGEDAAPIVSRATDIGVPISIVNVESSVQDANIQVQLEAIAEQTGGSYTNIETADGTAIAAEIGEQLVSEQAKPEENSTSDLYRVLAAGLGAAAMTVIYKNRRSESAVRGYNVKGAK